MVEPARETSIPFKFLKTKNPLAGLGGETSNPIPTGIKALWFRLTGQYKTIKKQNESEAMIAKIRDRGELQTLIGRQQSERKRLQHEVRSMRYRHVLGTNKSRHGISVSLGFDQPCR